MSEDLPTVSILLSAYNEEKRMARKMENLLSLDYPERKLEILVGSDGSTDQTPPILERYRGKRVRVFSSAERRGKPAMLNQLVRSAKGEILLFTDARQEIERKAVRNLVRNFGDPKVGGASGELVLKEADGSVGKGLGFYWTYEKFIRKTESDLDSVVGATGALYAVRRSLVVPIPEETILDDVYLPMKIVSRGFRVLFEGSAHIYDESSRTAREEYERKVRTLAGNCQSFAMLASLLNPLKSRIAFQFISHKLLRILAPFFLAALFFSNGFLLLHAPFFRFFFWTQLVFYALAWLGSFAPSPLKKLFSAPYVFCLLNASALVGLYRYLSGRQQITWQKGNVS